MKKILICSAAILTLLPATVAAQEERAQSNDQAAIEHVVEQQIMWRRENGDFQADEPVTRIEFTLAAIDLLRPGENFEQCYDGIAPSLPPTFTKLFSDVPVESWFGKRLCAAMRAGLIQGLDDGSFRPFRTITAAEASKIIARLYGLVSPAHQEFGRAWYQAPMLALRTRGAISPSTAPDAPLVRLQMAMMFYTFRNERDISPVHVSEDRVSPPQSAETSATEPAERAERNRWEPVAEPACSDNFVRSPGAALMLQERNAFARGGRRSRRLLRQAVLDAAAGKTPVAVASTAAEGMTGCAANRARSPGAALMVQPLAAGIRPIPHRSHRVLRDITTRRTSTIDATVE